MSEPAAYKSTAARPAKSRWWYQFILCLVWLTLNGEALYRQSHGDWIAVWRAAPAGIALVIAVGGALVLLSQVFYRLRFGRWMSLSDWMPENARGWVAYVLGFILILSWALRWSLPDQYPGVKGTDWLRVASSLVPNGADALALSTLILFFIALNWWFGFIERDRARAMERDRINALAAEGRRSA